MRVFVSGATGFIGKRLVKHLANENITVHALVRSVEKTLEFNHHNIQCFAGDICDAGTIENAMRGCQYAFHLAAYARVWSKDKSIYRRVIYDGTINLLEAALKCRIKKVVIVSTAGVFGPSEPDEPIDENTHRKVDYFSLYEKYKDRVDRYIIATYRDKINFCIVCPTRVYGPGELSESNSVTKMIKMYHSGKFWFLPGDGSSIGNYVYVDDVLKGIMLALHKGKRGERYILGGENITYGEFFQRLSGISGIKHKQVKLPVPIIMFAAHIMQLGAILFRCSPLITPGWARKYLHNWYVSDEKARSALDYRPMSLKSGLKKTLVWLLSLEENK